ncbi:C1QL [Mytilus coruscus]|uniref:C1QL n=1 Tax=Mytilus coruscus TaxID=42192 RepID=A0A6J8DU95_MYTCO|nr:C1QL [Mytilus coruscus]
MKQKLDTTIEENQLLKERVDVQSKDIKVLKGKMQAVLETNAHLTRRLDTVSEENRDMRNILITLLDNRDADVHVATVAFSAKLNGGLVQLGQHQTVGYHSVYTNIGNAYDSRHNHFIVPEKGVYLLSFTGVNVDGQGVYLEIVTNRNQIAIVYCSLTAHSMDSQTIVEVLEKGDVVWVRHGYGGPAQINGNDAYPYLHIPAAGLIEQWLLYDIKWEETDVVHEKV